MSDIILKEREETIHRFIDLKEAGILLTMEGMCMTNPWPDPKEVKRRKVPRNKEEIPSPFLSEFPAPHEDMPEIVLDYPFFNLPGLNLEGRLDEFILDTEFYEMEFARRDGGLYLPLVSESSVPDNHLKRHGKIVPYHIENQRRYLLSNAIKSAETHRKPFAKVIKDVKELEKDVLLAYQVSYAHYVIAKHYDFRNEKSGISFPNYCCGIATEGVLHSLWIHGLLNATRAVYNYDFEINHVYVILPFVMLDPHFEGVILLDPTSCQLGHYEGKIHRNLVAVKQGQDWTYQTHFSAGDNLFPKWVTFLRDHLINDPDERDYSGKEFLKAAYSNPVVLEVPLRGMNN